MIHQFSPSTYTGPGNIDITNNGISLNFPLKINGEMVLNPRLSGYFEMYAGTLGLAKHNVGIFYKTS